MLQDNGIFPGLSYLNQRSLLYSPKIEKTGNLANFLKDFHKENIRIPIKYTNISLTDFKLLLQSKNRNKMTESMQNQMQKEFLYFHQTSFSEIIFNYYVQSISKEFALTEKEGTQQNHSIENLHHK